jgi:hypothetical protein
MLVAFYLVSATPSTTICLNSASLYIFLHECANANLGHSHNGKYPRHVEEMEAEKWAHAKMREHGVPVPRVMTKRAKRYVARKIRQAKRRGAKRINREALAFSR